MPYASYTYMTDADALAIRAYLSSLPPVHRSGPPSTFSFPFNQRRLMAVWSALFNPEPALRAASGSQPALEPRRLSGRGHGPLRRLPHAAQPRAGAGQPPEICRRRRRRLAGLQHHRRPRSPASAPGATRELAQYLSHGPCAGPRHRRRADGRGGRPQPQPSDAVGHRRAGHLSAHHPGDLDARSAAAGRPCRPRRRTGSPSPTRPLRTASGSSRAPAPAATAGAGKARSPTWRRSPASRAVNDPTATNVAQMVISALRGGRRSGPSYHAGLRPRL